MDYFPVVPYNTGKVKIGVYYEPPRRMPALGAHAELLQRALLHRPPRRMTLAELFKHEKTK